MILMPQQGSEALPRATEPQLGGNVTPAVHRRKGCDHVDLPIQLHVLASSMLLERDINKPLTGSFRTENLVMPPGNSVKLTNCGLASIDDTYKRAALLAVGCDEYNPY
jgi:hypothetical protein